MLTGWKAKLKSIGSIILKVIPFLPVWPWLKIAAPAVEEVIDELTDSDESKAKTPSAP